MRTKKFAVILTACLLFTFTFFAISASAEGLDPFKTLKNLKQDKTSKLSINKNFKPNKNSNLSTNTNSKTKNATIIKDRQVIIKFKNPSNANIKNFKVTAVKTSSIMKERGMLVVRIPDNTDFDKALAELKKNKAIEYAEPNYGRKLSVLPNDNGCNSSGKDYDEEYPNYIEQYQWYINKIGLPSTWNTYKGSSSIKIAVIDTGIDTTHPDLQAKFAQGYDFINDDTVPDDECQGTSVYGHGSMVSGIIGAATNNTIGIAGINWNCQIMPLKVASRLNYDDYDEDDKIDEGEYDCSLSDSAIISAIYYAIDNGANVINMSYGGGPPSIAEYNALYSAYKNGIVLVAAAGNDWGSPVSFPAAYPFVISVGATDFADNCTWFSNYGIGLDISAPGEYMYSTKPITAYDGQGNWNGTTPPQHGYTSWDGTSFSSPTVAGVAALLLGKNSNLSPDKVAWLLESSSAMPSEYSGDEWSYEFGYGRVDASSALSKASPSFPTDVKDNISAAKLLSLNQTYSNKLELPMDVDLFKFLVPTGASSATIDIGCPSSIDIYAELYKFDPKTGDLDYDNVQTIDVSSLGETESITVPVSSGTYYLMVSDYYGHWSDNSFNVKVSTKTVSSLKASTSSLTLPVDSVENISLEAKYSDGTTVEVTPTQVSSESSNISIADVAGTSITAISPGKATITFSFGGKTAKVSVTVKPRLTNITFDKDSLSIETGKTDTLKAIAHYADGTTQDVSKIAEWGSYDESIATVSKGKISAISAGDTDIVVTFGGETVTLEIEVTSQLVNLYVSSESSLLVPIGYSITPTIFAEFSDDSTLEVSSRCTWTIKGTSVEASSPGTFTAVSKGKATLTGKYGSKKVTISVTVTPVLESVFFKESDIDIVVGRSTKLKVYAKYVGDNKSYDITKNVTNWYSDDDYIASVLNGTVTGESIGDTSVYIYFNGQNASVNINVVNELTSISIEVDKKSMVKGESQPFRVIGHMKSGQDVDITNDCAITLDTSSVELASNGEDYILQAIERGKTKITAKYGSKRVNVTIKVVASQIQN